MQHVDHTHTDYDRHAPKWKRCRDAIDGQDAIHAAGPAYLPKLKDQAEDDYRAYVKRAGFYNATWRTTSSLIGMMFRKPPTVEVPVAIEGFLPDIDMAGTSVDVFARKIALEVMGPGRVGILVDHPRVEGVAAITVAAAEEQGLRPMLKTYRTENIINWKYARVRNRWVLAMVVLTETVEEPDGEFKANQVTQWRVLDLDESGAYRQRVFRKVADGFDLTDEFRPMMRNATLDFLPFYIVGPDGIDSELDEPPLIDLVDVNLSHYRTNADYEHGCHFTGLPTAVVSGYSVDPAAQEKFYIGSTSAWVFPDPNAKAAFLEFTGQGLGALEKNLDRKENQMAVLGARMLAEEKRAVEAAETASIHRAGENSVLATIAQGISEGIETALGVFADWAGAPGEVTYQLNRDYNPAMLDAAQLTALMKMVQTGSLSEREHYTLMQRADLIDSEKPFEDHQEEVDQQGPVAPVVVAPANDVEAAA